MTGRLCDYRWWLCGRGRRQNVYAIITTLLLIVVAVQRRGSTDYSSKLDTTAYSHRRQATSSRKDLSVDVKDEEQKQPIIGLFLVVNLDHIKAQQWNLTNRESPALVLHTHFL